MPKLPLRQRALLSVSFPAPQYEDVTAAAHQQGETVSEFVRKAATARAKRTLAKRDDAPLKRAS